ncbi:MAG: hypothetical protein NTW86_15755 [Candidatus Sumerlaeota bacterium]|nr:hypothetical protein [Candidatus Sumerlaeota bacterium]
MSHPSHRSLLSRSRSRWAAALVLAVFGLSVSGCFHAKVNGGTIFRPGLEPTKMTGQGQYVGNFEASTRAGWLLFALIPVMAPAGSSGDWSYQQAINEIQKRQGDAARNIEIRSQMDWVDVIVAILVGGLFNTSKYTITGEVVKY